MKANESLQNDQATATERALRRAVDTTPAFIHTARPDGYIDYFNRGWLDFFGKSLEDVCGWRWTETVHPEDVTAIVQKWRSALAHDFYSDGRHEMLHEVNRRDVITNLLVWLSGILKRNS
jgi:PAS domain S-box-containing protein